MLRWNRRIALTLPVLLFLASCGGGSDADRQAVAGAAQPPGQTDPQGGPADTPSNVESGAAGTASPPEAAPEAPPPPGPAASTPEATPAPEGGPAPAPVTEPAVPTTPAATGAPVITSPLTATGIVGSSFTYQITATNSPTSFSAAKFDGGAWIYPPSLTGSGITGIISGTLTEPGIYTLPIKAKNSAGVGAATLTLTVTPAVTDFSPQPAALPVLPIEEPCPAVQVRNPQASIQRVWLAQTHLMETNWPFFQLVENRPTLVKLDVIADAATPVPTLSVTAVFADGSSDRRCLRPPAALPSTVDSRPQPLRQDLSSSYAAVLPADWLRKDVALRFEVAGGPVLTKTAAELNVASQPALNLVLADVLLFGETKPVIRDAGFGAELLSKLPVSRLTTQTLPHPLWLPRLVIGPRDDSVSAFGDRVETPAMWADRKPGCSASMRASGQCAPHSAVAVMDTVLDLLRALQAANGIRETSLWFGLIGQGLRMGLTGWWSGGVVALGDDLGKSVMHENGHSMGLPHLGSVTGARQRSATGLRHPYVGEVMRFDQQLLGGGVGRTHAWDPLDNTVVPPTCTDSGLEKQEPLQRGGCETVRTGRQMDHYSDATAFKLLRFFNGSDQVASGSVPYYSSLLAGSSADNFAQVPYQLPVESGRIQFVPGAGAGALQRWDAEAQAYVALLRPPGGDAGFLSQPPAAPPSSEYVQDYDFRFPQSLNVPVISVYGTFNFWDDTASVIYAAKATRGHLMRLWDPTDETQLGLMRSSPTRTTFWPGHDLHVRVFFGDGSVRHVAMPFQAKSAATPMEGFTHWAVNLPDEGKTVVRIELLHRPLCSRDATASDRSCDLNLTDNGITAQNVYAGARVAAVWAP